MEKLNLENKLAYQTPVIFEIEVSTESPLLTSGDLINPGFEGEDELD